jgi:Family of unknown function (DUF5808)
MSTSPNSDPPASDPPASDPPVPDPQGRFLGMPYDLRKPTLARLKSRWWNPADRRILTPKTFGAGWDINLYWFAHPAKYRRHRDS